MGEPLSLSTTAVATAFQCMKRYQYRNVEHLVTKPHMTSVALRRGIWIHSCLEAIHRGRGYGRLLTDLADWAVDAGVPQEQVDAVQTQVVHIITGYQRYWAEQPAWASLEPVAAEVPLDLALPNGDHLTATIDTIVRWKGRLFIMEHKSTARFPGADWRTIDPQTAQQYAICKLTRAFDVEGIIFNYLSTYEPPVPQVLKNGSGFYARDIKTTSGAFERGADELRKNWPDAMSDDDCEAYITEQRARMVQDGLFYHREVVYKPDALVVTILRNVKFYMDLIRHARETGVWPHSINIMHCERCPYAQVCPVELFKGGVAEGLRREYLMVETPETRREGRPVYDDDAA